MIRASGCDRYQNIFRIVMWLFFLFVYSQAGLYLRYFYLIEAFTDWDVAVREPLEKLDPSHDVVFDQWEAILYVMAASYTAEGVFSHQVNLWCLLILR